MLRITIITLLLLICSPVLSQGSAWVSEQQCAAHATVGPWTFDGTILMTGYGGLHGLNASWDTPRVVARIGRYPSGILSPNGQWYATLQVNVIYAESFNNENDIQAIQVYSTLGDNVIHTIPWQDSWLNMWGFREMYWLNNDEILYEYSQDFEHNLDEMVAVNPFNDTVTPWKSQIDVLDGGSGFNREYIQFPSPDFTSTIYRRYSADGSARIWGLYDVATGTMRTELQSSTGPHPIYDAVFAWLPDSSGFVGEMPINADDTQLFLYDKDGHTKDQIFDLGPSRIGVPQNIHWSPDGRYLAFAQSRSLFIADTRTNQVIDTCLSTARGFAWSTDSAQIAFLQPGNGTQNVYVFDLPSWSYRAVGRHIVETAFWDQIVGWRRN